MKKVLAVLAFVLIAAASQAQWLTNGTSIYYSTGNVGIGTSAPGTPLHVVNATAANIRLESAYAGSALQNLGAIQMRSPGFNQGFAMAFRRNAAGYQDMLQTCNLSLSGNVNAEFMYFRFDTQKWEMRAGVADVEFLNTGKISLNNGGAVGIGMGVTAIPAGAKLAIAGKVVCKEIEVTLTGLPDFVFSSDYKLRSLYDVENFININKHLPEVPSAKEVVENGLNLGDMNATLLQKVEELTLYMIQLQKENDALKARVSNLEK
jgi:hypothetical protein